MDLPTSSLDAIVHNHRSAMTLDAGRDDVFGGSDRLWATGGSARSQSCVASGCGRCSSAFRRPHDDAADIFEMRGIGYPGAAYAVECLVLAGLQNRDSAELHA